MSTSDDDDEELELKQAIPMTYKMPKEAKYDGNGDPKLCHTANSCVTQLFLDEQLRDAAVPDEQLHDAPVLV
ncbi:hypothetical protein JCGZ_10594 [Jatropha curcas]|uniref:Uncharacterized protein n=1 Tax=Jatropha curcas TaxID=180498 RepID=A0A067KUA5_JATCU|nr:hypothetical protein JCGZ_10594 [Jatropha curcas]